MRFPKYLEQGGTIGFMAPSFGCATEPYLSGFHNARKKFEALGYKTVPGPNCYESAGVGISNTPEKCGAEVMEMFGREDVDCLISCGGGELMCEILPYVDFKKLAEMEPKWFMGYSDNTNLTYLLATLADTASVYGPCAGAFGMEPWHEALQDAFEVLTGERQSLHGYGLWEKESLKDEEHPLVPYNVTEPVRLRSFVGRQEICFPETYSLPETGGCKRADSSAGAGEQGKADCSAGAGDQEKAEYSAGAGEQGKADCSAGAGEQGKADCSAGTGEQRKAEYSAGIRDQEKADGAAGYDGQGKAHSVMGVENQRNEVSSVGTGTQKSLRFSGRLLGGCLDCLVNLSGTRFDKTRDFAEKYQEDGIIWFLEACDLNVFAIRRAMWQLEETGWFQHVKGFLIGRALNGGDMMGLDVYNAVLEVAGRKGVPVIMDVDLGHLPPMMPLIVGSLADVTVLGDNIEVGMRLV